MKKPKHRQLLDRGKEFNTRINKVGVSRQTIADFKTRRIMHTGYRLPIETFAETISAVIALHYYRLTCERPALRIVRSRGIRGFTIGAATESRGVAARCGYWAHSRAVARRAGELATSLDSDQELFISAAALHDVGYAPRLAHTGFHPLDGGRFLRDEHDADPRLAGLVAHHTYATLGAEEYGLRAELEAEFPLPDASAVLDAGTYCDMTVDPGGVATTPTARIAEIRARHDPGSPLARFIARAEPAILETCLRVEAGLGIGRSHVR